MAATLQGWAKEGLIPTYGRWNKINPMADPAQCGYYRPDFSYEWDEGVLLLEYDEQMHSDRNKRCELVRMAQMYPGYGGRPLFWIRFNPDAFNVADVALNATREEREVVLLKMLQDMVGNADYGHPMTICYICYDKKESTVDNIVQTFKFTGMEAYEAWVNDIAPA
jgi:hypothetical protein